MRPYYAVGRPATQQSAARSEGPGAFGRSLKRGRSYGPGTTGAQVEIGHSGGTLSGRPSHQGAAKHRSLEDARVKEISPFGWNSTCPSCQQTVPWKVGDVPRCRQKQEPRQRHAREGCMLPIGSPSGRVGRWLSGNVRPISVDVLEVDSPMLGKEVLCAPFS